MGVRRRNLRRRALLGVLILLAWTLVAVLAFQAVWVEPYRLTVEEVRLPIAGLPPELDGLRIVQLSDLHMTGIGRREAETAARVRALAPDMIVITGDFIQHTTLYDVQERWMEQVREWLLRLGDPPLGIWASRGNADISRYGDFNNLFADGITGAGVHLLTNRAAAVRVGNARMWIAGADSNDFQGRFVRDFTVQGDGTNQWLETGYSQGNSTVHYWAEPALAWSDYEFTGRLRRDHEKGGIGVTFYSRFPEGYDRYYRLRSYAKAPTLQIAPHGARITAGNVDTGVVPEPGRWYRFRIRVENLADATRIRARVWLEGEAEPAEWLADCLDERPERLRAGTVGAWGLDDGHKAFDDFQVRPTGGGAPWLDEDFAGWERGRRPAGWLAYGMNAGNVAQALAEVPAEDFCLLLAHS
ncbi:MAG: metallophosphoesterase, partial [Anaerolineae bacterium]